MDDASALTRYFESCCEAKSDTVSTSEGCLTSPRSGVFARSLIGVRGSPRLRSTPDESLSAAQVGSLYEAHGERFLADLCGAFSLAIIDPARGRALLAIDRMGIERMTYWGSPKCLVFSDRADIVADAPGVNSRIVNQRIYDFLFFHMIPAPHSVFDGVRKLEPGTYILFENGTCRVNTYWRPCFRTDTATEHDLAAELFDCLQAGVRACDADDRTGAFLSGGLDSSTVAGMMRRVLGRAAPTFSIGFGVPGYDELSYARIANSHFGCNGHEYVVTPDDVLAALPVIAAAYDEPFGNSSAVPVLHCARLAKQHGMAHLLAGDGGDELFAGNDRYAKQKVFELYGSVPVALRERVFSRLVSFVHPNSRITPLRKLRSYVEQASIPLPERLETWNYAYREGIGQMLAPEFAASIDVEAPMRHMREVFNRPDAEDVLDRELAYDWHFTLADSDLPKVSTMCELAGIAVSYPMLDHRLVDLCLKIPANMKLRGLSLRSFYKRAMRDFLPKAILDKKKHGFGLPFGIWLKANPNLAEMIYSNLSDLKNRQIFRGGFIDELIAQQRAGHHAYYGFFLWDLAILEQWLNHHNH